MSKCNCVLPAQYRTKLGGGDLKVNFSICLGYHAHCSVRWNSSVILQLIMASCEFCVNYYCYNSNLATVCAAQLEAKVAFCFIL